MNLNLESEMNFNSEENSAKAIKFLNNGNKCAHETKK